jgi:photoactive yellow protein
MDTPKIPLPMVASLVDHIPIGVVVVDRAGKVVLYNRYEEILAARKRENVVGRDFFHEVAPCMNVKELGGEFRRRIGSEELDVEVEFAFPLPFLDQPRDVVVRMSSFETDDDIYGSLFIEDVSAARSVERMKETLQSLLVHDLKSPLAVAMSNMSLLKDTATARDDAEALELAESALNAGRRLERMVVNLLDITRLETNTLPLNKRHTDVSALIRSVVEETTPVARIYGVELVADLPSAPVELELDPDLGRRAISNLVDNAMRFAKTRIIVRAAPHQQGVRIEVEDDGKGVPEDKRTQVFEKYARVEGAQAGRPMEINRGLGLTFVRLAARSHGGDVGVDNAPGGGAVFWMNFHG